MKRILSLALAAVMTMSVLPVAYAADTNDHSQGTQVVFEAANNESYTITVPAKLNPGQSGTVTLAGSWPDNKTVSVTADKTVTLTNSIKAADTKTLNVNFDGISEAGSNIEAQTFTEDVSVDPIEAALFGTWSGKFNYNVEITDNVSEPVGYTGWKEKTWNGFTNINGNDIWTDGTNFYYSGYNNSARENEHYVLNGDTWEPKTWNEDIKGCDIWTDGTSTYYSNGARNYVLNGDTWETKTWNGLTAFTGDYVWTDGTNIYYSFNTAQYVLNGDTWEPKAWNITISYGYYVWTDGTNIYYSYDSEHYVLNGDTWEPKTWNGLTSFNGNCIWTDGTNIYYSVDSIQYVLNGDTWQPKTWNNAPGFLRGTMIWTDGTNIYFSGASQSVLIK